VAVLGDESSEGLSIILNAIFETSPRDECTESQIDRFMFLKYPDTHMDIIAPIIYHPVYRCVDGKDAWTRVSKIIKWYNVDSITEARNLAILEGQPIWMRTPNCPSCDYYSSQFKDQKELKLFEKELYLSYLAYHEFPILRFRNYLTESDTRLEIMAVLMGLHHKYYTC